MWQLRLLIDEKVTPQLRDAVEEFVLLAKEYKGVFRDGRVHLQLDIFIEDQGDQALAVIDPMLNEFVAELACGRKRREHDRHCVGAQEIGLQLPNINGVLADYRLVQAANDPQGPKLCRGAPQEVDVVWMIDEENIVKAVRFAHSQAGKTCLRYCLQ